MIYASKKFTHTIDDKFKVNKYDFVNSLEKKLWKKKNLKIAIGVCVLAATVYYCINLYSKKQNEQKINSYELVNKNY